MYCDRYCQPLGGDIGATQLKPGQTIISVDGQATVKRDADEAFVYFEIQVDNADENTAWRNARTLDLQLQNALRAFFVEFNGETRARFASEDRGDPDPPVRLSFLIALLTTPNL